MCKPGELMHLVPEPKNPVDPNAIMVVTPRGITIGYVRAEYAAWYAGQIASGRVIEAAFQTMTGWGAVIRVAFDGEAPTLPDAEPGLAITAGRQHIATEGESSGIDPETDFYPDEDWPD